MALLNDQLTLMNDVPYRMTFLWRYLVTSADPDGTRRFLTEDILRRLAQTRLCTLHAGGQVFTFSELNPSRKTLTIEILRERVSQATDIFQTFQG